MGMGTDYPFFGLWVRDFLTDPRVDAMTAEELGAFFRLLLMAWQEDPAATLPPDEGLLARWARLDTARWSACRERILSLFAKSRDGRLVQNRLRKEYERVVERSAKRSHAGKTGAKSRWQTHSKRMLNAMANVCDSASVSESVGEGDARGRGPPRSNLACDNPELSPSAKRVVEHYEKTVTAHHGRRDALENVIARLRDGKTADQLKKSADAYAAVCRTQQRKAQHRLAPATFYTEHGEYERHLCPVKEKDIAAMTVQELADLADRPDLSEKQKKEIRESLPLDRQQALQEELNRRFMKR